MTGSRAGFQTLPAQPATPALGLSVSRCIRVKGFQGSGREGFQGLGFRAFRIGAWGTLLTVEQSDTLGLLHTAKNHQATSQ